MTTHRVHDVDELGANCSARRIGAELVGRCFHDGWTYRVLVGSFRDVWHVDMPAGRLAPSAPTENGAYVAADVMVAMSTCDELVCYCADEATCGTSGGSR